MAVPRFIDPAETKFAHSRTDMGAFDKMVEMNERLAFVPEPVEDAFGTVIMVGLQRSGTTLAYQIAAGGTDAGYINNLIARFWQSPAYGVHLFRHLGLRKHVSTESIYGTTESVTDVHEFGYFWASLLGAKSNSALSEIDPEKVDWRLVRDKLLSINSAFGKPCIHKNTLAGHFMDRLGHALDKKLFVYVKRDFLEIASSILKVRKARYGDVNRWWSLKPREYDQIASLSPHEQIAAQIHCLHQDLEKQARLIPSQWLWEVSYDDICAHPSAFLMDLKEHAARAGIEIGVSGADAPPQSRKSALSRDDEDVRKLAHFLDKYGLPYATAFQS